MQSRKAEPEVQSMKRLLSFIIAIEVLGLITACQTASTGAGTASQKETLLLQAGFKSKTVTTPKQQERVSALPEGKVSAVKYKGRTYYVYPHRDQRPDPGWQPGPIQRLQTVPSSAA